MSLDFTNRDYVYLYNNLCSDAVQDLEGTKNQIRTYFTSDRAEELELYREKIFVAKLRSEQFDSHVENIWSTIVMSTLLVSLTDTIPSRIVELFNLQEDHPFVIALPIYIATFIILCYVGRQVWIRRKNSKSEKKWTNEQRILYFLEKYNP